MKIIIIIIAIVFTIFAYKKVHDMELANQAIIDAVRSGATEITITVDGITHVYELKK